MPQRNLLITDFFVKLRPTSTSNAALFNKSLKVQKSEEPCQVDLNRSTSNCSVELNTSSLKHTSSNENYKQTKSNDQNKLLQDNISSKSSVPSRIKFVRHHSAPLHHRSPVKTREYPIGHEQLEDLRTRIHAFRRDLYKYKSSFSRSPVKRSNIIGDILASPFKQPLPQTPVKSYPTTPAYERFNAITTTIELPLPNKYELLLEQFKYLDFLVCHTHNNGGISTFEKMQKAIQQKTKRNFTLDTLGRIKTVYPTMYRFQQEKIQLPTLSPVKLDYELTIAPNDFGIESNKQITPSIIVERIDCFRRALFHLVKKHHRAFLCNKLQLKVEELPNDDNLARWHPDFDLINIPDIDISPLPESLDKNYKRSLASPIEIRRYAATTPSDRVKRALFSTFSNDDRNENESINTTITLESSTNETYSIDGICPSLIEKIRSKETNNLLTNTVDQRKQILSRLEQMINIVQQFFIAERTVSLEFDRVVKQVRECHLNQLSYNQSAETLHFLHTYPANNGWLSIISIRGRYFIKINRHKSINTIIETIQRELQD